MNPYDDSEPDVPDPPEDDVFDDTEFAEELSDVPPLDDDDFDGDDTELVVAAPLPLRGGVAAVMLRARRGGCRFAATATIRATRSSVGKMFPAPSATTFSGA